MNFSRHRFVLWLSQYQIISVVITVTAGVVCIFLAYLSATNQLVQIPLDNGPQFAFYPNIIQPFFLVLGILATIFTSTNIICLIVYRLRPFQKNWSLIAVNISTLLLLVLIIVQHFSHKHYAFTIAPNSIQYGFPSSNELELLITQDPPDGNHLKAYAIPFNELEVNQVYRHKDWPFSLQPSYVLPFAATGGPNSKVNPNELAVFGPGVSATHGPTASRGIKLFEKKRTASHGSGAIVRLFSDSHSTEESYLVYHSADPRFRISPQPINCTGNDFSIVLRPRIQTPNFAISIQTSVGERNIVFLDRSGTKVLKQIPLNVAQIVAFQSYTFRFQYLNSIGSNQNFHTDTYKVTSNYLPLRIYQQILIIFICVLLGLFSWGRIRFLRNSTREGSAE